MSLLLGMLSYFVFVPPQVERLTHAEAVVIYLSTGATAPISAGAGAMPSITDAGVATKLVRSTTPMRLGLRSLQEPV